MNILKIITAVLLTVVLNTFMNLSDRYFHTVIQANIADFLITIGVIGILSCQIIGAYTILTHFEKKGKI